MLPAADTIAAIATARGRAALAIVRLSGPEAIAMADRHFPARALADADSHTAHVGFFTTPQGEQIDQVVITLFRGPHSATGEDVVEISCHGGDLAPQLILRTLLENGARLARAGEFTERAFLHGKLDLTQAEAVADLIHAQSSLAHRVSVNHLRGRYSDAIAAVREELLQTCALVELELDFAEEDVEFADRARLEALLDHTESLITSLLDTHRVGALVRDGVRVVIGGRPNAGKSTLLNALVAQDRAIVSATPGTTRDEIEAEVEMNGLAFRFVDTAGLRSTDDAVEAEGVRRAHASIDRADIVLYVYDLTCGLEAEEEQWLERFTVKPDAAVPPVVLVGNKADAFSGAPSGDRGGIPVLHLSAQRALEESEELDLLRQRLVEAVGADFADYEATAIVVNQRHRQHLTAACEAVGAARAALEGGLTGEALALDVRTALHELGAITGEITNEDVLGTIFSRFCIGK